MFKNIVLGRVRKLHKTAWSPQQEKKVKNAFIWHIPDRPLHQPGPGGKTTRSGAPPGSSVICNFSYMYN